MVNSKSGQGPKELTDNTGYMTNLTFLRSSSEERGPASSQSSSYHRENPVPVQAPCKTCPEAL